VLLEALACGTPVVATAVFGSPEVIGKADVGLLVNSRTPEAFAQALEAVLRRTFDRKHLRAHAEAHSWDETCKGIFELFVDVCRS
jgi:glycosyltransferase involved in cell wall biosynthesis